jgi:hypothetical protein
MRLLSESAKTKKSEEYSYLTAVLHLSPHIESGHNMCPYATQGCAATCLGHSSGRMRLEQSKQARIKRTVLFRTARRAFIAQLIEELTKFERRAKTKGLKPAVRLNGTSDIRWEVVALEIFQTFPNIQFYDYTKDPRRVIPYGNYSWLPKNYHLTYSQGETETSKLQSRLLVSRGQNVAVVFNKLPESYMGRPVIDGDLHDLRFLDPSGIIVGLKAKGAAKQDTSGFVVHI